MTAYVEAIFGSWNLERCQRLWTCPVTESEKRLSCTALSFSCCNSITRFVPQELQSPSSRKDHQRHNESGKMTLHIIKV